MWLIISRLEQYVKTDHNAVVGEELDNEAELNADARFTTRLFITTHGAVQVLSGSYEVPLLSSDLAIRYYCFIVKKLYGDRLLEPRSIQTRNRQEAVIVLNTFHKRAKAFAMLYTVWSQLHNRRVIEELNQNGFFVRRAW